MTPYDPGERYDVIGRTYGRHRRPEPRIAVLIDDALGGAQSVVNVGSGTGSYELKRRGVVAVEPSLTMIRQRPAHAAPVVRAAAEHLPFTDDSFDVALAILTIHHWSDFVCGLRELARVAPKQVIMTWDPAVVAKFWLVADYLPDIPRTEAHMATLRDVEAALSVTEICTLPVPWDCADGFLGAYWRRPEIYLDPEAHAAISGIARYEASALREAMRRLQQDLADGTWKSRNKDLLALSEIDLGSRLVVAHGHRSQGHTR
jgi:SAM-dependent methyltransferase